MKKIRATALMTTSVLLVSCGSISADATDLTAVYTAKQTIQQDLSDEFIRGQTAFALNLLQNTAKAKPDENILLSPYSLMQQLAMSANGAAGNTAREMTGVLAGEMPIDKLNEQMSAWRGNQPDTSQCRLVTANSIWLRNTVSQNIRQEFLQTNADFYNAAVYSAPFDHQTVKDVNNWVKDKTDGMINKLIEEFEPNQMMLLLNAVSFDAKWETQYQKENVQKKQNFHAADGTLQTVTMLRSDESRMINGDNWIGFKKAYDGCYDFCAILPDEGISPAELLGSLDTNALLQQTSYAQIDAKIPVFSYDDDNQLNDALNSMGIHEAFTNDADFSGMTGYKSLLIGKVLQKTHIELDADGTRAGAASSVGMKTKSMAPTEQLKIVLDRPFIYLIADRTTGIPVFTGIVQSVG